MNPSAPPRWRQGGTGVHGFKIHVNQVDVDGKILDFGLIDPAGNAALLEVKGWTAGRWNRQLDLGEHPKPASRGHLKTGQS